MATITQILFHPHGTKTFVNGKFFDAYTDGEYQAQSLTRLGLSETHSKYTPHDAGNEIIQLAERIKSERAIMAMSKP